MPSTPTTIGITSVFIIIIMAVQTSGCKIIKALLGWAANGNQPQHYYMYYIIIIIIIIISRLRMRQCCIIFHTWERRSLIKMVHSLRNLLKIMKEEYTTHQIMVTYQSFPSRFSSLLLFSLSISSYWCYSKAVL